MTALLPDTLDRAVAGHFTGEDPEATKHELRTILRAAMLYDERSLPREIGPSEVGNPCERCLAYALAGDSGREEEAWLPFIGRAVHEYLEQLFHRHENARAKVGIPMRFLPESRVNVGEIDGIPVEGNADLFDVHTGTVVDYKIVGATTLKGVKAHGAKPQYEKQAHLYGRGYARRGFEVRSVLIWFMPRNAIRLDAGIMWQRPYSEAAAIAALDHATNLRRAIGLLGLQTVLAGLPPHIVDDGGDSFTCRRYADFDPIGAAKLDPSDPFGSTQPKRSRR